MGSWVNPRAGLDHVKKRKFFELLTSVVQLVASSYTDYAIPAPICITVFYIIYSMLILSAWIF
jgi:hypothetical protein